MGLPSEFILTDVRCFEGEQSAKLRPITLLIGENNTGKTTFLGCYSVFHNLLDMTRIGSAAPDFNQEPFWMGSFRDIVRTRLGPQGRINTFSIGLRTGSGKDEVVAPFLMKATLSERGSQPMISNIRYEFDSTSYFEVGGNEKNTVVLKTPSDTIEISITLSDWNLTLFLLDQVIQRPDIGKNLYKKKGEKIFKYISDLFIKSGKIPKKKETLPRLFAPRLPDIVQVAPLRSKPQRTYNPVKEVASPEGDHVPMLMMRLVTNDKRSWQPLHDSLSAFGRDSGMFSDIRVRRLGKKINDSFQLQVKARSGVPANIMDVGYGVSQSLPILVDIHNHRDSLFLLQQPEVHLHPRAQAELATVFAEAVRKNANSFLVETHSDYIVDRTRILVRQKKIPASDVSILFFEPTGNSVQIHNITVDSNGNLDNVPPGYRDFFRRESDRLLGFEE